MPEKYFGSAKQKQSSFYLFKKRALTIALGAIFFLEIIFLIQIIWVSPYGNIFSAILPGVLTDLTNSQRQQNNLSPLATNPLLVQAAELKAQDMAAKSYFSHQSPDGKTPWSWLEQAGYGYLYAGENLAVNFADSQDIEQAWMDSASHRSNILNSHFTEIGVATAEGVYNGHKTIFVVQFFGRPATAEAAGAKAVISVPKSAASVTSNEAGQEMFVAKAGQTEPEVAGSTAQTSQNIFSAPDATVQSSWLAKVLIIPKAAFNYIYMALAFLVLVTLLFKFFLKDKRLHPKLIANGIFVLFVVISLLYLNSFFLGRGSIF